MLTGKLTDAKDFSPEDNRRNHPRFQGKNFSMNRSAVQGIIRVAHAKKVTAAQVALAWLLAKGLDILPIPSAKTIEHLTENAISDGIELTRNEVSELEAAFPLGVASGARYAEADLAQVNR